MAEVRGEREGTGAAGESTPTRQGEAEEIRPRYSWTQPQCLGCWYSTHPGREPVRLTVPEPETCVTCGGHTTSGTYIRIDPAEAPYPTRMKD